MSFWVIFLLITSRRRWEPASGAKVRPLFRTFCIFAASFGSNLSIRRDGSARLTFLSSVHKSRLSISSFKPVKSLVLKEDRDISSNPLTPAIVLPGCLRFRFSFPARAIDHTPGKNRQPRMQPRKISSMTRSCTVSMLGTTN